jgi:DNA-binding winged helix-turn-helix (wHTH) protein
MRLLEKDGVQVALRGRALDILICLAERAGEVVSRKEIDATVWPDMTVVDGCLRFHVVMLRKALGDTAAHSRYIANVPGRGYCFVARVARDAESSDLLPAFRSPSGATIDPGPGALGRTPDREPLLRKLG